MPLIPGKSKSTIAKNFHEIHKSGIYKSTKKKYGKEAADRQAVAIVLSKAKKSKRKNKGIYKSSKES